MNNNYRKILIPLLLCFFINPLTPVSGLSAQVKSTSPQNEQQQQLYIRMKNITKDSLEKKVTSAEDALMIATKFDNRFLEALSLIYIARNATSKHDPEKAKVNFQNALAISKKINNESLEAETGLHYGFFLDFVMNRPDSALIYSKKAYLISLAINDTTISKNSSAQIASIYNHLGDPVNSIHYAKIALEHCKNDLKFIARIYTTLALVYNDIGNFEKSIEYYKSALKISEQEKDDFRTAGIYNNLASAYSSLVKHEASIEYHKKALSVFTRLKDSYGIAYSYNLLGMTYSSLSKPLEAVDCFKSAVKIFRTIQNKQSLSFSLSNLAAEYLKANKPDESFPLINEALKYSCEIKDRLSMADAFKVNALYLKKKNRITEAIASLQKAEQYAREMNNPGLLLEIYNEISFCCNEKNDSKNAFYYLRLKDAIADSIRRRNADKALIEMMVKYETTSTKEEIEKSKTALSELQIESDRKKNTVWIIIAVSLLLISLLLFIFWKKITPLLQHYKAFINLPFSDRRKIKSVIKVIDPDNGISTGISDDLAGTIISKLQTLMSEEKIFLKPDLTLVKTSDLLGTNTTYLSRIINEHSGLNFSSYLNKYRIEEAKKLLIENEQAALTFEGIAKNCGFISRSAFNQAFKRFTGQTPTEYVASKEKNN